MTFRNGQTESITLSRAQTLPTSALLPRRLSTSTHVPIRSTLHTRTRVYCENCRKYNQSFPSWFSFLLVFCCFYVGRNCKGGCEGVTPIRCKNTTPRLFFFRIYARSRGGISATLLNYRWTEAMRFSPPGFVSYDKTSLNVNGRL